MKLSASLSAALVFIGLTIPQLAIAQYNVQAWYSFEEPRMPSGLRFGHNANEQNVRLFTYATSANANALLAGIGRSELGARGIAFSPQPVAGQQHLSLFSDVRLDRQRLGQRGRALYQADIFLPAQGQPFPTTSLLAAVAEGDGALGYRFYRFGVMEGGERVFFSFTNGGAEPAIFHQDMISNFNLRRPGWHRFQIIFEGQENIVTAINTVPTSFSPVRETTHRFLNPGLWVSAPTAPASALIDNLSIQWTTEDVPLPQSPWTMTGTTANLEVTGTIGGSQVHWLRNPQQAWSMATSQRRPILTLFYAPNVPPYEYLESIMPQDGSDGGVFDRYILLKIDANQLAGGQLAQDWRVFRLPTFVVVQPDGNTDQRVTVINRQTTWEQIRNQL